MILGTAAYMSPEQARGKTVDKRADIWAFGCVLFEMLTGTRAFTGDDVQETFVAIMRDEPEWARLPAALSPTIGTYLRRCVQKDPRQRVQAIGDVRLALEGVFDTGASQSVGVVAVAQPMWRRLLPYAADAVVASVVMGLAGWSAWPANEPRTVTRFDYVLPEGQSLNFAAGTVQLLAVSPEGRHFVYSTLAGLYIRAVGELDARLIPGTTFTLGTPNFNPVFSPDGESIAYFVRGEVRRIAISGGAPVVIAKTETEGPCSRAWLGRVGERTTRSLQWASGIWRVSGDGGTSERVISNDKGESMGSPRLLPDGDSVLFSLTTATGPTKWDQAQIVVQSLRTGARTVVMRGGSDARYVPSGHLVYAVGERSACRGVRFRTD